LNQYVYKEKQRKRYRDPSTLNRAMKLLEAATSSMGTHTGRFMKTAPAACRAVKRGDALQASASGCEFCLQYAVGSAELLVLLPQRPHLLHGRRQRIALFSTGQTVVEGVHAGQCCARQKLCRTTDQRAEKGESVWVLPEARVRVLRGLRSCRCPSVWYL